MTAQSPPAAQPAGRRRPFIGFVRLAGKVAPQARPRLQRAMIGAGYDVFHRRRAARDARCLNYGYEPPPASAWAPTLDVAHLADRYGLQLYDRVAGAVPLADREVLEVGCGRGGGTAYVAEAFRTRSTTGVDLSAAGVAWCLRTHRGPGLDFMVGDAEALPFPDAGFDAVLNVESSHCYPDLARFLDEVARVLRPGGALLFADLRPADRIDEVRGEVARRFDVVEEEDITADVVRALRLDAPRREEVIGSSVPRLLRPGVRDFFAVPGSEVFGHLESGGLRYLRLAATRPGAVSGGPAPSPSPG